MTFARSLALTVLVALFVSSAVAASEKPPGVPKAIRHYESVAIAAPAAGTSAFKTGGATSISFATLGRQFDLELEPNDVFASNAVVHWVDDAGTVDEPPALEGSFYRGRVAGEQGSWVRLRVDGGELNGIVASKGELYFVEPAPRYFGAWAAGQSIAYRLSDVDPTPLGVCAADEPEHLSFSRQLRGAPHGTGKTQLHLASSALADGGGVGGAAVVADKRAELGIVADWQYYNGITGRAGHGANSASDLAAIINAVDGVYQSEIGVAMQIRSLTVYTTANDPFTDTADYSALLNEFSTFHDNNDNTSGQLLYGSDLAHLITGRDMSGNVIGYSWVGTVCQSYAGTGVSEAFNNSLYIMTLLLAHEMGHNFGARHDNDASCSPVTTTFIMNPFISSDLLQQFSQCSKDAIGAEVTRDGSCFDAFTPGPSATPTITYTPTRTWTLTPSKTSTPTRTPTPAPIGVPAITQPGINQVLNTGGITFAWNPVANATGYDLQILRSAQTVFSGSLVGNGSTSTLIVLPTDGSYQFKVRACINAACGPYASRNFSIDLTTPIDAPDVTFPASGATLTASVYNFSWTQVAAVGLPVFYELELTNVDSGDTELGITVADPTVSTVVRLHNAHYSVHVRACQAGCGPWSTPHDFTATVPTQPTSAPTVTQATLSGNNLTVNWSSVAGAEWYQVYVIQPSGGPGGGALTVAAREVVGNSTVLPVPIGAASVIAAACTGNGCGPFSGAKAISSSAANPNVPNLGTPLGGSVVSGPTVLFTWNRIPGDNGSNTVYRLYVQDLSRGTAAFDVYTTDNFYGGYFRAEGARYDALVVANPGPSQVMGPATGFIVSGQSSSAPTMAQPAHNSTVAAGNVQLGWTPVPGATLYEYFVAIPGSATPPTRGVTPGNLVQVPLIALNNAPTMYSAIVRACPAGATCAFGSDTGWGPWSNAAGPGVTNFTVTP